MNKLFFWSITSALAGFIFGFDTVVISGAEQTIQKLWGLSPTMHGIVIGSALYGTIVGALIGGKLTDSLGRRKVLLWIGLSFVITAFGTAFAPEVWTFLIARFIGGLGIGVSTIAAPSVYFRDRPRCQTWPLAGSFQFNIVFGILVALASNAASAPGSPSRWSVITTGAGCLA